jgi:polar amino acid transport system substrate-binding protein
MKFSFATAAFSILTSILAVVFLQSHFRSTQSTNIVQPAPIYSRILASGKIRCGYVPYPPGLIKDPNTGEISGVFADAIKEAAANLGLKVEWAEEVGWGTMIQGLDSDRYDAICSPVWANSSRSKVADFTVPLFYSGIGAYVRADDTRFASALSKANSSEIRVATIDGEMSEIIASSQFARAQKVSLPQTASDSQLLLNIVDRKADITFVEPYIADLFLKTHPSSIKNLVPDHPVRVFGNTIMIKKGTYDLQSTLDVALGELINSGEIDRLLNQYTNGNKSFYPTALPYRVPEDVNP